MIYGNAKRTVKGVHCNGTRIILTEEKTVKKSDVLPIMRKNRKTGEETPVELKTGNKCIIITKTGKEKRTPIVKAEGDFLTLASEISVRIEDIMLVRHIDGWLKKDGA